MAPETAGYFMMREPQKGELSGLRDLGALHHGLGRTWVGEAPDAVAEQDRGEVDEGAWYRRRRV